MACLRSPRPPADAAQGRDAHGRWAVAIVTLAIVALAGCEAVFPDPALESAASGSSGPTTLDTGNDQKLTTDGDTDPSVDSAADDNAEVDGGPHFDLGQETGGGPPPPRNEGECCIAAMGIGCIDEAIEACVCAVDPVCCESGWDELCAKHVEQLGCGACIGTNGTRDVGNDCCIPHGEPGCGDADVAECVCADDPFCCMVGWDQVCVDLVLELGCDDCIEPLGPVDPECCTEHAEPGCADPEITACVCEQDPYCCDTSWDSLCADEVDAFGCAECYGQGTTTEVDVSTTGELGTTSDANDSLGTTSTGM